LIEVLEQFRAIRHTEKEPLNVALSGKYINGQTDAENAFTGENIFANFSQYKFENTLLVIHFLLIDKNDTAIFLVMNPVSFPNSVTPDNG
jgi:hypothetical protein